VISELELEQQKSECHLSLKMYSLNFISFTMLTDNQVFLALFSALVTSVLAIRLAATLYQ
jgi:photosystem I reaction center subunit XII